MIPYRMLIFVLRTLMGLLGSWERIFSGVRNIWAMSVAEMEKSPSKSPLVKKVIQEGKVPRRKNRL